MLRRWLPRLITLLVPFARAAGVAAASCRALYHALGPTALQGFVGLALVFAGAASFSWPLACLLTGLLLFRDATRPTTPPPPAT